MSANALGVIAAIVLLVSFILRGEKKIRLVNLIGCVFLILWAVKSTPTNYIWSSWVRPSFWSTVPSFGR